MKITADDISNYILLRFKESAFKEEELSHAEGQIWAAFFVKEYDGTCIKKAMHEASCAILDLRRLAQETEEKS